MPNRGGRLCGRRRRLRRGGASANVDFGIKDSGIETIAEKPLEVIGQAEEGAIPLALILLALGIALSSLLVIWSAPIFFAEILVDALLAAGPYRRLRVLNPRHWMVAVVRRTLLPFILTTLFVVGLGWGMQAYAPEATSLGEVLSSRETVDRRPPDFLLTSTINAAGDADSGTSTSDCLL